MNMDKRLGEGAFGSAVEGKIPEDGLASAVVQLRGTDPLAVADVIGEGIERGGIDNTRVDDLALEALGKDKEIGNPGGTEDPNRHVSPEDAPAYRM